MLLLELVEYSKPIDRIILNKANKPLKMSTHIPKPRDLHIRLIQIIPPIVDTKLSLLQNKIAKIISQGPDMRVMRCIGPVQTGDGEDYQEEDEH